MRIFVLALLFWLVGPKTVAQVAVQISKSNYDTAWQVLDFNPDKWVFKQGNDSKWADPETDVSDWKKISLDSLSKYADKNGKVEVWLRQKIKLDSMFRNMPLRLYSRTWGASEVYIDGKRIKSFGNTGSNGKPFEEYNIYRYETAALPLEIGKEYVLAWHFVDYVAPIGNQLKSYNQPPSKWLYIATIEHEIKMLNELLISRTFDGVLMSVTLVLSIMFWFLTFLIPTEKNLKWIATGSSLFALLATSIAFGRTESLGFTGNFIARMLKTVAHILIFTINPVILARLFGRVMHKAVKMLLIVCTLSILGLIILDRFIISDSQTLQTAIYACSFLFPFLVSVYYVFTSWKNVRGAQWALIVAFVVSILAIAVYFIGISVGLIDSWKSTIPVVSIFTLSPSIGMLAYVSLRFIEILKEVRTSSEKVLQLSEEKREQAENQQKMLEAEVDRQTHDLKQTLSDLKATQSQLIQSEKMASLGELTAGIAHEIQNPLNFVNNFSDVSIELLDEMETEIAGGDLEEAKAISSDIKQNLEKINHHGKRADAIVKGMLLHSRNNSGAKELTDLNALCDEYVRLSYHGLRANDKSFNATIQTDFDQNLQKINIIPQDIGRVVLNLLTNAFYAVNEKKKMGVAQYEPTVSISTIKHEDTVEIKVSDNGDGMPSTIVDKIFQPFFTTKPTGKGTGLGLSLSYDIVVKGHNGQLDIQTQENEGTTFTITLPIA